MLPERLRCTVTSLPKRDELLLWTVLALPKASITGFACITCFSNRPRCRDPPCCDPRLASASKLRICFVASVLPAPDSPEMMHDWLVLVRMASL